MGEDGRGPGRVRVRGLDDDPYDRSTAASRPFLQHVRTILEIDQDGALERVGYDEAMPVVITRAFLSDPRRSLHELLDADPE